MAQPGPRRCQSVRAVCRSSGIAIADPVARSPATPRGPHACRCCCDRAPRQVISDVRGLDVRRCLTPWPGRVCTGLAAIHLCLWYGWFFLPIGRHAGTFLGSCHCLRGPRFRIPADRRGFCPKLGVGLGQECRQLYGSHFARTISQGVRPCSRPGAIRQALSHRSGPAPRTSSDYWVVLSHGMILCLFCGDPAQKTVAVKEPYASGNRPCLRHMRRCNRRCSCGISSRHFIVDRGTNLPHFALGYPWLRCLVRDVIAGARQPRWWQFWVGFLRQRPRTGTPRFRSGRIHRLCGERADIGLSAARKGRGVLGDFFDPHGGQIRVSKSESWMRLVTAGHRWCG